MTIRRIIFVCALLLFSTIGATRAYACGCGCDWVCNDRCQIQCTGCTVSEAITKSEECCEAAHQATGDLGPCAEGGLEN